MADNALSARAPRCEKRSSRRWWPVGACARSARAPAPAPAAKRARRYRSEIATTTRRPRRPPHRHARASSNTIRTRTTKGASPLFSSTPAAGRLAARRAPRRAATSRRVTTDAIDLTRDSDDEGPRKRQRTARPPRPPPPQRPRIQVIRNYGGVQGLVVAPRFLSEAAERRLFESYGHEMSAARRSR